MPTGPLENLEKGKQGATKAREGRFEGRKARLTLPQRASGKRSLLGVVSPHLHLPGEIILRAALVNFSRLSPRFQSALVNLIDFSLVFSQFLSSLASFSKF